MTSHEMANCIYCKHNTHNFVEHSYKYGAQKFMSSLLSTLKPFFSSFRPLIRGVRTVPQLVDTYTISALIIGLTLILGLRALALFWSNTDLFFDEAQYWVWSQSLDFGYFSKPPVIAWLIRLSTEICGFGEACVRLASPFVHSLTAFFLFLAGRAFYNTKIGFIAALAYITLPGVSFSATLISTDVPLLMFWAFGLWALAKYLQTENATKQWGWAIALGFGLGFGLMSKYAMIYFVLCCAIYAYFSPQVRARFTHPKFYTVLGIAFVIVMPNLIWNLQNGLVTFSHTAANANWQGALFHPFKALEFFGAQFGVFGPILFGGLLVVLWRFYRTGQSSKTVSNHTVWNEHDKLLLCFSVPIITIIVTQAFLSRAHANWAATAYPAATLLVVSIMMRDKAWIALRASFVVHGAAAIIMLVVGIYAGRFALPGNVDPFWRVTGWQNVAQTTRDVAVQANLNSVIVQGRALNAELLYYLRGEDRLEFYSWKPHAVPKDHFQLTRPFDPQTTPLNVLLVTFKENPNDILTKFDSVRFLEKRTIPAGQVRNRTLYFYQLVGYNADAT